MNLKERYKRFKEWQRNPFVYKNTHTEPVRCANCDTEFTSNYCPMCGQKAEVGPVGWNSIHQSIAVLWGLDSRSLVFTLIQLLLRPGYLISDYISGRRQFSFPPVKMLFVVAVAFGVVYKLFYHPKAVTDPAFFMDQLVIWVDNNPGWGMLLLGVFIMIPTLLVFRYAPRHTYHKLPEGFFIQVFMATIALMFRCVGIFLEGFTVLVIVYFFIAYYQLFGYGWWGSLWRTLVCFTVGFALLLLFVHTLGPVVTGNHAVPEKQPMVHTILISYIVIILPITHFINKKTSASNERFS